MDTGYKLYVQIVKKRLEIGMEDRKIMCEAQTEYQKGRGR